MQRNRKVSYIYRTKEQVIKNNFEGTQMIDLVNRNFKAAIIHIFKEVKETKDLEESITMTHQIETIKKREIKKTEHKF